MEWAQYTINLFLKIHNSFLSVWIDIHIFPIAIYFYNNIYIYIVIVLVSTYKESQNICISCKETFLNKYSTQSRI